MGKNKIFTPKLSQVYIDLVTTSFLKNLISNVIKAGQDQFHLCWVE